MKTFIHILILIAFLATIYYFGCYVPKSIVEPYQSEINRLENEKSILLLKLDSIRNDNLLYYQEIDSLENLVIASQNQIAKERRFWNDRIKKINSANVVDVASEFWLLTND